ncbi:MAG: c-type cytochrome [Ferruginibacter sp.]
MISFRALKYKIVSVLLFTLLYTGLRAQDSQPAPTETITQGYNMLVVLLLVMIIILALVIYGMGQVLTALGRQLLNKNKSYVKLLSVVFISVLSLLSQVSQAQDILEATVTMVPNYGGLSATGFYVFIAVLATEVMVIFFLAYSIRNMYAELIPENLQKKTQASSAKAWWARFYKNLFTQTVSDGKKTSILPWWKFGFYITIGVAIIYMLNFYVFEIGLNPTQENTAEIENARIEKETYEAEKMDKIDEKNITLADAKGIKAGQALYEANCSACHLKDGGGAVGPNLADKYWLHGGDLNDIYNTIKNGYPDKGMQAWGKQFSPKDISFIASFIKSLKGTTPATPKEQQGDLYTEAPGSNLDSVIVATPDAVRVKKH